MVKAMCSHNEQVGKRATAKDLNARCRNSLSARVVHLGCKNVSLREIGVALVSPC